jgi:hypothetical protein
LRGACGLWGDLKYAEGLGWSTSLVPFRDQYKKTHEMRIAGDRLFVKRLA